MSGHLADFNILHTRHQNQHANSCNVVINNSIPTKGHHKRTQPTTDITNFQSPGYGFSSPMSNGLYGAPSMYSGHEFSPATLYPTPAATGYAHGLPPGQSDVLTRDISIEPATGTGTIDSEAPAIDTEALTQESNLNKAIAQTFGHILKDNNPKLLANIIDSSGKVICDAASLVSIISIHVNMPVEQVTITYEEQDTGCMAKVNPIRKIKTIKIASLDFHLAYNQKYNILSDTYFISLSKVLI